MTRRAQVPEEVLEKFILGFDGRALPREMREYLAAGLGAVILFPRNFSSVAELHSLTADIRRAAGRTALIGIDQEGGTQFSLPEPFTQWVSPAELGNLNDPKLVERQAKALARELRAAGCNLDFAPMLDLHLQAKSPLTLGRSFGSEPQKVAWLGAAFARGLASGGILACAKHFPGHGDTVVDPHEDLPVFRGTLERLQKMELAPFVGAIVVANVPMIMTAHILLPEIDPERPASLSRKILTDLLRGLGFSGVILADDLGMDAIAKRWPASDACAKTFHAGSDMTLLCHDWSLVRPALEGVASARQNGSFPDNEWKASHVRIARIREMAESGAATAPSLEIIGCAEHREIVREIRARLKAK
ncbi:MAG: glycoside hydrolase family 3 N-terminal domain-containing protein [Candidatus Acidiferrales bacterium]